VGEQAQGDWTLKIVDTAAVDVGTLRNWGIEVGLESAAQVIHEETAPGLAIPDNDPAGVSSFIVISESGTLQGIKVGVDITHTYIGDLRVELSSPSGQQAILHNRAGGGQDNLITTYDSITTPSLASLAGSPAEGNWVLRVRDLEGRDVGKLNKWSLEITI
jgi:subtilisin-like proprotein convertase family protein